MAEGNAGGSVIPMNIKWGKETIDINLIVSNGVPSFKKELEERTGVPCDRMKLMPKSKGLWKGVLKDDFDLSTINFNAALTKTKNSPLQVLLMGSATKLVAPKTKTVFVEDLPEEDVAKVTVEPSGLVNLGNTCYLNSVLQCLRTIPTFRKALRAYNPLQRAGGAARNPNPLVSSLRDIMNNLDRTPNAVPPANFVMATKMAFPQFGQTGPQGQPMQQDAEEFFSGLLTICAEEMRGEETLAAGFPGGKPTAEELNGASNLVDALFGLKMEETLTCDELSGGDISTDMDEGKVSSEMEPAVKSFDLLRKLVCNIQGGVEQISAPGGKPAAPVNINFIQEGINLSLGGKIEKRSEVLGRDAVWTRTQRIARLPPIITVQFGRFYWKQTPDSMDHTGVKCKVMKPVTFQSTLDMYEFCTEKVQSVLRVHRAKALADDEERINKKMKGSDDGDAMDVSTDAAPAATSETNDEDEDAALQAALAMSMETDNVSTEPQKQPPVGPGLPDSFQGIYELFAVVTHKGRNADGGHYMGWVKAEHQGENAKIADTDEVNDDWFVFDDDEVSPCKTEDVLKLKGGGDWHMSYLNFYRAKK
eukprot:CAMPEP_0195519598 /NCGR_PEP_ID=MMETSP0794_2-20130614/15121_1 /TAXON_ID=515487 /ORGANISM="Stephanopyxis turris, Strain CCMP 815" /LENGTH=589 /DNA_ID=CAMNT_0040648781 /DNA_START=60 /DNA_END=1829 /DNA_ORIENTATION=+